MQVQCPTCSEQFNLAALERPGGITGGAHCPKCHQRVKYCPPYERLVAILSLLIAWGILFAYHVHSILGFIIGTVLIWLPVSLYLNAMSIRFKPPTLKQWKPRRRKPRRRTFFEWLYERNTLPDIFDQRKR